MPESARRLALSNAAAMGLSIADYLVQLIMAHNSTPSVGVGQGEALNAVLNDRITSLEVDLASRQSVLAVEGMASSLESLAAMAADMLNRIVALEEIVAGQQQSTLAGVLERGLLSLPASSVQKNAPACEAAIVKHPPTVAVPPLSADAPQVSGVDPVVVQIWSAIAEVERHVPASWPVKAMKLNEMGVRSPRGEMWSTEGLRSWCRRNPVASSTTL